MVIAAVRLRHQTGKWRRVEDQLEEKQLERQRRKHSPSRLSPLPLTPVERSPSPSPRLSASSFSGFPKWDSSRPLSPPSHPRDGITNRVYGSPSPDPSLSRLDQQLARLRQTINTRPPYDPSESAWSRDNSRVRPTENQNAWSRESSRVRPERVVPERDTGIALTKPAVSDDDGTGTLSDISNYISRLEAVQSRLTDLKLSSYKIYDSNKSLS